MKENQDKIRVVNQAVTLENMEKDKAPGLGPVTSILSFVGDFQQEHRKESLIHGHEEVVEEVVGEEEKNVKNKIKVKNTQSAPPSQSRSKAKQASVTKPVVKKEESKGAAVAGSVRRGPPVQARTVKAAAGGGEKKAVRGSVTAPLAPVRTPGKVRATKSLTAPVSPSQAATTNKKNLTKTSSAPRPARAGAASGTNSVGNKAGQGPAVRGKGKKNFPYPKKVSSEYPSEILFKNQEGLKFSSVNFFEEEEGSTSRWLEHTECSQVDLFLISGDPAPPSDRDCWAAPTPCPTSPASPAGPRTGTS